MSLAALTPQLRAFLLCDEVIDSLIEEGVYTLEGVREQILVDSFPHWRSLNGFLVLRYPRGGRFRGMLRIDDETGNVIQKAEFDVAMDYQDEEVLLPIEIGPCIFPTPGRYTGEVWFFGTEGQEVQKGQRSLLLIQRE